MKIGPNRNMNKTEAKAQSPTSKVHSVKSSDNTSTKYRPTAHCLSGQQEKYEHTKTILFIDDPKKLAEKHIDEKLAITLLIVGTGIIVYHFWENKYDRHINDDFRAGFNIRALNTRKKTKSAFVLDAIYKKVVYLDTQSYFNLIIGL